MKQPIRIMQIGLASILHATLLLATVNASAVVNNIQLFNTGVTGAGGLLANETIDSHYSIISAPSPYNAAYTGNGSDTTGGMPWLDDGPGSRWIGVTPWMGEWRPTGTYTFRTTFDLSGMIPSTASIALNIAADNNCEVYLNGVYTGITTAFDGFTSFASYNITSGFGDGINTLDFKIFEPGSTPSGLRVEMTGSATVVPEPSVIGLGSLALLMALRRKQA